MPACPWSANRTSVESALRAGAVRVTQPDHSTSYCDRPIAHQLPEPGRNLSHRRRPSCSSVLAYGRRFQGIDRDRSTDVEELGTTYRHPNAIAEQRYSRPGGEWAAAIVVRMSTSPTFDGTSMTLAPATALTEQCFRLYLSHQFVQRPPFVGAVDLDRHLTTGSAGRCGELCTSTSLGYSPMVPRTGARLAVVGFRHVLQRVSRMLTLHTCVEKLTTCAGCTYLPLTAEPDSTEDVACPRSEPLH